MVIGVVPHILLRSAEYTAAEHALPGIDAIEAAISNNGFIGKASFTKEGLAGGEGFEPSTPNLGGWCSIRTEPRGSAHFKAFLLAQISRPATQ